MKIIRYILFPVVPIYFAVTWLRNKLYDSGIKSSQRYDFPVICIGNLSTGGTGKTPMIEYLVRLLKGDYQLATLSRGYKRITEGFILASETDNASTIGDEPFQFYSKYKDIYVAVDADRRSGISKLKTLKPRPEVILLDDAFQHRKVEAGISILLTSYSDPFYSDIVLPTGNLREPRVGYKRADIIVVTKCPVDLEDGEKRVIYNKIFPSPNQSVFFSYIKYGDRVISTHGEKELSSLPPFTLVTGIANPIPLVRHLKDAGLEFNHLNYPDHYNFKQSDLELLKTKALIVTTEKDFVRLNSDEDLSERLFYLPIEFVIDKDNEFNAKVQSLITDNY